MKGLLTVRGSYDGINVSEEEEPSNQGIESIRLGVRELLVHKGPSCLAEPPNPKRNIVNRFLEKFENLQYKILQERHMLQN